MTLGYPSPMHRSRVHPLLLAILALGWLMSLALAPIVTAASPSPAAASDAAGRTAVPRSGRRPGGLRLRRGVLGGRHPQAEFLIDAIEGQTKAEIAVYTQRTGIDEVDEATARPTRRP